LQLQSATQIGSGYMNRCDPVAFVVGPTGLAYDDEKDILYVASTEDNAVFAIHDAKTTTHDAGKGSLIYSDDKHLHGPLAMAMAPNGHLVVSNSDVINPDANQPSEIVEFTIGGRFVTQLSVDPAQGGSFGLAFSKAHDDQVRFAAVDDNVPNITIWNLRLP
jgi:DNA-binding beta-propeller fold protein YncE